jgi:hypothetical protein
MVSLSNANVHILENPTGRGYFFSHITMNDTNNNNTNTHILTKLKFFVEFVVDL